MCDVGKSHASMSSVESLTEGPASPFRRGNSLLETADQLDVAKLLRFDVPLDRALGIQFETCAETRAHSVVTSVEPGSVVADWNASCEPGREIARGAHLLEVNGVQAPAHEQHAELLRSKGKEVKLLMRIGYKYNEEIRVALAEVYKHADEDLSGLLSLDEFNACVTLVALELGMELDEEGIEAADADGSGYLDAEEFLTYSFALCERTRQSSDFLLGMFRRVIAELQRLGVQEQKRRLHFQASCRRADPKSRRPYLRRMAATEATTMATSRRPKQLSIFSFQHVFLIHACH